MQYNKVNRTMEVKLNSFKPGILYGTWSNSIAPDVTLRMWGYSVCLEKFHQNLIKKSKITYEIPKNGSDCQFSSPLMGYSTNVGLVEIHNFVIILC